MTQHEEPSRELYRIYREELSLKQADKALRSFSVMVAVVNVVFIGADAIFFRHHFLDFLLVRLLLTGALFSAFVRSKYGSVLRWNFVACLSTGAMLLYVINGTGGVESPYYVGLILLVCGIGVTIPFEIRHAVAVVFGLFFAYASMPIWSNASDFGDSFLLHLFFLSGACLVGVLSASLLDSMRYEDFRRRKELQLAHEKLMELDEQKSRFTANMHHELRTPLTLLLAPLEGMLQGSFGEVREQQRSYLGSMRSNALRLLGLINDLLDHSKIESGQYSLSVTTVDLGQVVENVLEGASPAANRKSISIERDFGDQPIRVSADPDALDKILVNLIGNALKFTQPGGVVSVGLSRPSDGELFGAQGLDANSGILLVVKDTGIGIAPDQLAQIFDRFAQVDGSSTREHEGSGIGLSLVAELVGLHGGSVWAESGGLGLGTSFFVLLPDRELEQTTEIESHPVNRLVDAFAGVLEADWAAAPNQALESESLVLGARSASSNGGSLVIAEDNPAMRRLFADLLSTEFSVRAARNGWEAIELVREEKPDLVVTDVMMPGVSGIDLCSHLKSDPDTAGIPVMLVTSKSDRDAKIEGLEMGADDYVTKPFHPRELIARARSLVRLRKLQVDLSEKNDELVGAMDDLKKAEVQLVHSERLAAIGQMAAGIAHEVNNPVNFSLNAARALKGLDPEHEDSEELVGIVVEGLERTASLVGDLRDFGSGKSAGGEWVDIGACIDSTVRLVRGSLKESRVSIDATIEEGLPKIAGDSGAIKQVILNLVKNAGDAMEKDGGAILVSATSAGETVLLTVEDNGPGIDDELADQIFDPFFTTKKAGEGTGLGLAICQEIAKQHHGQLSLSRAESGGTVFSFEIPIQQA